MKFNLLHKAFIYMRLGCLINRLYNRQTDCKIRKERAIVHIIILFFILLFYNTQNMSIDKTLKD